MSPRAATGLVLAVAAGLRLAHVLTIRDYPLFEVLPLDSESYDRWARDIVEGEWMRGRPFYQAPLYAFFLAALHSLSGGDLLVPRLANVVLGVGTVALVARLGARCFGPWVGVIAAALCAVHGTFLFEEGKVMKTSLAVFLTATSLVLLVEGALRDRERRLWFFGAGLACGLAALVRENFLLFVPFAALWVFLAYGRVRGLALLLGAVLPLLPTGWHNSLYAGEFLPVTSQAGQNFYTGVHPGNPHGGYLVPDFVRRTPRYEEADFAAEAQRRAGRALTAGEVSRYWLGQGLDLVRQDPTRFARLTVRKLGLLFHDYEIPDDEDVRFLRRWAPVLRVPWPGFGVIAVLGCLGLGWALFQRRAPVPLVLFVGVYTASVALFFVFSRYRLPLVVPLSVFGAYALVQLATALRARRGRPLAISALALAALAFVVYRPLDVAVGLENSHLLAGLAYEERGERALAAEEYARGLELAPDHPKLLRRAARLAFADDVAAGRVPGPETVERLRRAVVANPQEGALRNDYGIALASTGRADAAAEQFRASLATGSAPPDVRFNLAVALEAAGDREAALAAAEEALRAAPDDAGLQALVSRLRAP